MRFQEKYSDLDQAKARYAEMKMDNPTKDWSVIESDGCFYVEDGVPMVRTHERLVLPS